MIRTRCPTHEPGTCSPSISASPSSLQHPQGIRRLWRADTSISGDFSAKRSGPGERTPRDSRGVRFVYIDAGGGDREVEMRFEDRVIIVTGSGSGVGRVLGEGFAAGGAGGGGGGC